MKGALGYIAQLSAHFAFFPISCPVSSTESASREGVLTTTTAEGVGFVMALAEAGGTLRCNRSQWMIRGDGGRWDGDVLILN